jgi:transporter family-2 protein
VWTGGLLGAAYVLASIVLTPALGAAATVGFFLAGQMAASVAIDHFGLLGAATNEVSSPRILGLLLVLAGVFLIQRF